MRKITFLLPALLIIFLSANGQIFSDKVEKANKNLKNAQDAFEDLTKMGEDKTIPKKLLQLSEGMVIFPEALKVAFGVGGQGGRGFAVIRKKDGSWSNPYFVGMGEGNIGAQIGVQSTDLILIFRDREDILGLEKADLTLGGDVGIAAGPVGRSSSMSTDIGFDAEIYSYSRSKGLYAGISLEGSVIKANKKMNGEYYSRDEVGIKEVFYKMNTPFTPQIGDFLQEVAQATK